MEDILKRKIVTTKLNAIKGGLSAISFSAKKIKEKIDVYENYRTLTELREYMAEL